jgi:hypothetical protein
MTNSFKILNFGHCNLFDICYLGFGIFNNFASYQIDGESFDASLKKVFKI